MPPHRNPFAGLARTAQRGAATFRAAAPVASRALATTSAVGRTVITKTKRVYDANKEPTSAALTRASTEYTGHGLAYVLDRIFQWRAWDGWMRPSFFLGVASFVGAALTGGKWSRMLMHVGDGVGHHYAARGLDKLNQYLTGPDAPSGTAGTEQLKPPTPAF